MADDRKGPSYAQPKAIRRRYPVGEWRDLLPRPDRKAAEAIARAAVVCEYITARSAATAAGINTDAAHAYLELLTDLGITSEILEWDPQNGRGVFHGRGEWEQVKANLRAAPLR